MGLTLKGSKFLKGDIYSIRLFSAEILSNSKLVLCSNCKFNRLELKYIDEIFMGFIESKTWKGDSRVLHSIFGWLESLM